MAVLVAQAADEKRKRVINTRLFIGLQASNLDIVEIALAGGADADASYDLYYGELLVPRLPFIHIAYEAMVQWRMRLPEETVEQLEDAKQARRQNFYRLLEECKNLDAVDIFRQTIVMKAVHGNQWEILQQLAEKGYLKKMNLNLTDCENRTALTLAWAVKQNTFRAVPPDGNDKIINALFEHGVDYRIGSVFLESDWCSREGGVRPLLLRVFNSADRPFLEKMLQANLRKEKNADPLQERENDKLFKEFSQCFGRCDIAPHSADDNGGRTTRGLMSAIVRVGMANPYKISPNDFDSPILKEQLEQERQWWKQQPLNKAIAACFPGPIRVRLKHSHKIA